MTINFQNLETITQEIQNYKNTELLIVSKKQPYQDVFTLLKSGYRLFGENRVQEASVKYTEELRSQFPDLNLNLIGPLQSNKTKQALMLFDTIQSLDRKKIIDEIIKIRGQKLNFRARKFFIQINIGRENQKSGIDPINAKELYNYSLSKNLNIIGLMCIPPNEDNPKKFFADMCHIRDEINPGLKLSMGMSSDYICALNYGSNIIRIGSKIFK